MTNLLISSVILSSPVNLVSVISVSQATGEGSAAEQDVPLVNPAVIHVHADCPSPSMGCCGCVLELLAIGTQSSVAVVI